MVETGRVELPILTPEVSVFAVTLRLESIFYSVIKIQTKNPRLRKPRVLRNYPGYLRKTKHTRIICGVGWNCRNCEVHGYSFKMGIVAESTGDLLIEYSTFLEKLQ